MLKDIFVFPNILIIIGGCLFLVSIVIAILLLRKVKNNKEEILEKKDDTKDIEDVLEDETSLEKELEKIKKFTRPEEVRIKDETATEILEDTEPLVEDLVPDSENTKGTIEYVVLDEEKDLDFIPKSTKRKIKNSKVLKGEENIEVL